jgi:hypothetical protein
MEKAWKLLENIIVSQPQLPASYHKFSLNPLVIDGMITLDLLLVNPIDHVVNMVMSLVEPVEKVVDPISSSINPTLPLKS